MRVLITGGAGFIGSHLVDRLLDGGDEVLVVDNFATGRRDNLAEHPRLALIEGTIADEAVVGRALSEGGTPDVVVHAAAAYKDPDAWAEDVRTNILGTVNVVNACRAQGVSRLIYFQTALCYGLRPLEQPITLSHPLRPEGSSYAVSKTAAEAYIALSALDWVSFRLANAYGPRNRSGPLPTFYARLVGGQDVVVTDTRRDFVYVADLVDCVLKAVGGTGRRGPYHISSGSDHSIKELYDVAVRALGIPDGDIVVRARNPDDAPTILLDPAETEHDFGWRATTPLAEGVASAIADYRARGVGETFTHLKHIGLAADPAR